MNAKKLNERRAFGVCGNGNFQTIPGIMEECLCCGKDFKGQEIVVECFEYTTVCPDCILSGTHEMARRIRTITIPAMLASAGQDEHSAWHINHVLRIASTLEGKQSVTDFPGGIFALKIAEAYKSANA